EAQRALAAYEAALERWTALSGRRKLALERRDEALKRRETVRADNDAAQAALDAAHAEEQEQRALLARLDAALRAREAAEHLARLRERLEKAEAQRALVEAEEGALSALSLPPAKVQQLQDIELDLMRLRAARAARLPSFRIDYEAGAEGRVRVGAASVEGGREQNFAATAQLAVEGIGTIT